MALSRESGLSATVEACWLGGPRRGLGETGPGMRSVLHAHCARRY